MRTYRSGAGRRTRVFQRANAPDKSRRNLEIIGSPEQLVNFDEPQGHRLPKLCQGNPVLLFTELPAPVGAAREAFALKDAFAA